MLWRKNITIAAVLSGIWLIAQSATAIPPEIQSGKKTLPKDSEVYALLESPLATIFDTFQAPIDTTVADADTKSPSICLDYGPFGYIVRDNKVSTCIFWANWPGTIGGISFGQTYDQIVETLGKPQITSASTDGTIRLLWNLKDKNRDLELMLEFIKDKQFDRAVVRRPVAKSEDIKTQREKKAAEKKQETAK